MTSDLSCRELMFATATAGETGGAFTFDVFVVASLRDSPAAAGRGRY